MSEPPRKIIHIDMDCFYAAIEMRDNPDLTHIPLAIGGAADKRGVISTCNYVAREYGVRSAMATAHAYRLCPQLTVMPGRMSYYYEVSQQIREILRRYGDRIEPLSLDEAYLDVSDSKLFSGSATLIAEDIRRAIREELKLTASAGVAPNKFLAKISSDEKKPDGLFVVTPGEVDEFVRTMPLRKIPGVGKVTAKKLEKMGLVVCQDVRDQGLDELVRQLGSFGEHIYKRAHGIDERELTTEWIRKSVSVERTFPEDIETLEAAGEVLGRLYEELIRRLEKHQDRRLKNQQVKLKFSDFRQTTIERGSQQLDIDLFKELLPEAWHRGGGKSIRLLGMGVSFYEPDESGGQLELFG